jgi:hypothetical protein
MKASMEIINRHFEYLLEREGGVGKAEQWLLADDRNFNAITAERYIINYLQKKNKNVVDCLRPNGIDAYLNTGDSPVGIEITTLNSFLGEWIFIERLRQVLIEGNCPRENSIEIKYSYLRINTVTNGGTIYDYIRQVGRAILSCDMQALSELEVSVERIDDIQGGGIVWELLDGENIPWFDYLTNELYAKLKGNAKVRQLKEHPRNLVFVGINYSSPSNGIFPSIFGDLRNSSALLPPELQEIEEYWYSYMFDLTNVIGICYFAYTLDSEIPFYPLKIFWRSKVDQIAINL